MVYVLRRLAPKRVELAKFEDRSEPIATYNIVAGRCDCPSRVPCKHPKLVDFWKEIGEPIGCAIDEDRNYYPFIDSEFTEMRKICDAISS